ncbi:NAD P-binding protein [Gloeophyllum trabeum ATCC 11539]|uniref:NAD P-binding protein n=1 Tax=Gloeophyllum trabeum (strain ATCC 11539 / FP-39264 / Madison 617) TaxID=670483 RepID=S7Q8G8_GLOTA|nr:NAD P-binding protein [Gloeophyllum trabeum ATCC 11539]EPQ55827.1 NAD P-binding protein [Gloeophyllum trabeum ATCC 11539]
MVELTNPATMMSRRFKPEEIPDQTGRVAIVTGGSAGIGFYDALELAQKNARVIIISATEDHGKKAEEEINKRVKEKGAAGSVEWIGQDLGDLKGVDALAKRLASELPRLDILILNAGVGQGAYGLTKDGLGNHFAVNDLAHYVIALRLLPLIEKTVSSGLTPPGTARIVFQSSETHRLAPSDVKFASKEEINDGPDRDAFVLYGRSKLGMIYNAKGLAKRKIKPDTKIVVTAVHPGTVDTDLQDATTESYGFLGKVANNFMRLVGKNAQEGAEASLWAATTTEINADNWTEYQANYYSEPRGKPHTESDTAKQESIADNYWELCASLTREILGEELR